MICRNRAFHFVLAVAALLAPAVQAKAQPSGPKQWTYLALGDSLAFGYSTAAATAPSRGDQGYVAPFADWLGARRAGVRPRVINLAVPGETTSSYFTGGRLGEFLNLNYRNPPIENQRTRCLNTIWAERAAGRKVKTVTIQLGANDVLELLTPEFLSMDGLQQRQILLLKLRSVASNYTRLLREIRAAAPQARLALVGYYNPLAADPSGALYPFSVAAVEALNGVIAAEARAFHAKFVDVYTPFTGREAELTYMAVLGFPDGIHPLPAGYALIAQQLIAAFTEGDDAGGRSASARASVARRRRRAASDHRSVARGPGASALRRSPGEATAS